MGFTRTRAGGSGGAHGSPTLAEYATGIHGVAWKIREIVKDVADAEVDIVQRLTPRDTGLLAFYMAIQERTPSKAAIAPVGDPSWHSNDPAPEHTIRDFVDWAKSIYDRKELGNASAPWKSLSPAMKAVLRERRMGGEFGGPYPPPVYFGAVDQGLAPQVAHPHQGFSQEITRKLGDKVRQIIRGVVG